MAVLIADRFHVLLRVIVRPVEQDRTGPEEGFDVMFWLAECGPDNICHSGFTTESKGMVLSIL